MMCSFEGIKRKCASERLGQSTSLDTSVRKKITFTFFVIMHKKGEVELTILIAMAARPSNGEKPYVLFGSDSLEVKYRLKEDGTKEAVDRNESQQKIFRKHDKLFAFTGLFDLSVVLDLPDYLENRITKETDIKAAAEIVLGFIKGQKLLIYNISVIIGQIDSNEKPSLVGFDMDGEGQVGEPIEPVVLEGISEYWVIVAGEEPPVNLNEKLKSEIDRSNLSISSLEKSVEQFLRQVASEYPETCNQNIRIEKLM